MDIEENLATGGMMAAAKNATKKNRDRGEMERTRMRKEGAGRPVGRPRTTIDDLPVNWKQIMQDEASIGHGAVAWQVKLSLNTHSLNTLLEDSPEFRTQWEICMLLQRYWWEDRGLKLVQGAPGNAAVYNLMMVNKFGYIGKQGQPQIINNI
ncbi:MAG TPA: hypothetical protein VFM18_01245, partial [Methanosarcina sp.]|nr:hypothetical protein [Methanosarcina sp.]